MDASEIVFQNDVQPRTPASLFSVMVKDKVEKSGTHVYFFLTVQRNSYGESQEEKQIKRSAEDFRALDRRLRNEVHDLHPGVITPRLSTKDTSMKDETTSDNSARFMGEYAAERVMYQRYITTVLNHPIVGHFKVVEDFLELPDFASQHNFKQSMTKRITGAVEELWTANYVDPEVTFQTQKISMGKYSGAVADFSNAFSLQNICKKSLSSAMANLSASIGTNGHSKDDVTNLWAIAAEAIQQEEVCPQIDDLQGFGPLTSFLQQGWHLAYWNGELTLGSFLKHHIAQLDSFKDMMQRRTVLLQDRDTARRVVDKSKPLKKDAAVAALDNQIQLVDRCTAVGKEEIRRLSRTEILGFRQALIDYAESQMKAAQESYEILQEQIEKLHNCGVD